MKLLKSIENSDFAKSSNGLEEVRHFSLSTSRFPTATLTESENHSSVVSIELGVLQRQHNFAVA